MNKKRFLLLILATLFAACNKNTHSVEFDITVTGLSDGVVAIKNQGTQTIFGENVKNGKCIIKGYLEEQGFYQLEIAKPNKKAESFEVYIEPGKYTVTTNAETLSKYPKIESESKKQQEISNYYVIYDEEVGNTRQLVTSLNKKLEAGDKLNREVYRNLAISLDAAQDKARNMEFSVLDQYVKKYPQSELAAHFMDKQAYTDFPEKYQKLFSTLSPAAKGSEEGKEISKRLESNLKLLPGKKAPAIQGQFFDGRSFAAVTAGKKIFLVDFWRSVNQFSRTNHDDLKTLYADLKSQKFEIISVSMDKNKLWWSTALKDDQLPWPQISDLKGNDSPNAANWNITTIPTYYLVDGDWNIYMKDVSLGSVRLEVTQYLEKHH